MAGARFQWNDGLHALIETIGPQRAHDRAASVAAGRAAAAVGGKGTGTLARRVAFPRRVGILTSLVGAPELPYAGVQNDGATIYAKGGRPMLIRGTRSGGRSTVGGEIVASADVVEVPAKRYLDVAVEAYPPLLMGFLRGEWPRG